jgi:hypothetical protein
MKIILDRWQGLGDNLQISTIPRRMFEKYGEKCVWISDASYYRNPEIRGLVWEKNPYIAGFTSEPGESMRPKLRIGEYGWIETWERLYGLDSPYSTKPEVFLDRKPDIFSVSDKMIVDISYSRESLSVNERTFPNFIKKHEMYIRQLHESAEKINKKLVKVKNPNLTDAASVDLISLSCPDILVDVIEISNIYDYCNVLSNCSQFISTHSGNHSLASAVRDSSICFIPAQYLQLNYFVYSNVNYIPL